MTAARSVATARRTALPGHLPERETRGQRAAVQAVGLIALAASIGYLIWRASATLGADLWLAVPLLLLEAHAVAGLALYVFSLWDVDGRPVPPPVRETEHRVAVLIPTYNEPREVILPTIAAAVALAPAHETWVLDDGDRPWVRELAEELGAGYLCRPTHEHAKAGNLNHAIGVLDADIVGVLDCDHVPAPGFLSNTLGYFADPRLAVVQTPQDFYNADSFEHGPNRSWFWRGRRSIAYNEQRLFYRAIQPGKNRWNAAFWCGTSALLRVGALLEVGGVAYETLTEDIHTTVRMHRRGWRTVFHNEVLAYGVAASDARQYQQQRNRWGTGAMQLLRLEHPLSGKGLTLAQRTAYAATLLGWFDAWRTVGYVVVPLAVLFTGAAPISAPATTFGAVFGAVFLAQRLALAVLARGYAPQGMAVLFEFIRMPTNLRATLTLLRSPERRFEVTSKGGSSERSRVRTPGTIRVLLIAGLAALAWFGCVLSGWAPTTYRIPWVAYGAAGWTVVNIGFLLAAARRITADRYAADRRRGVRLRIDRQVLLDGRDADLVDISVGGALVRVPHSGPAAGCRELELTLDGERITLLADERNRMVDAAGGALIAMRFLPGQDRSTGQLLGRLFTGATEGYTLST